MKKLQDICRWRRVEPADSPYRMEDTCKQVPEELKPEHGAFTSASNNKNKNKATTTKTDGLKSSTDDSETIQQTRTSGVSSTASGKMILKPDYSLIL